MSIDYYKQCYEKVKNENKHNSELSVMELTGYYLTEYPMNSIDRLIYDMSNNETPYVLGERVKLLLQVVLG